MSLHRSGGEFWGRDEVSREAAGFRFQAMRATAREDDVHIHTHEAAHFVLVLSGAYISSARHAPALSCLPLLIFNPPGTTHRDRFLHGRGLFMAVTIGPRVAAALGGAGRALDDAFAVRDPFVIAAARTLCAALDQGRDISLEGQAWSLTAAVHGRVAPAASPPWLRRAFEMIWSSDDPGLTVADVAADAGVHPVHLARVFRRHLGCAPGELLRGRRLERAAHALGHGTASLAQAAADEGFVDQSHLTRAFGARFGLTPAAFRRARQVAPIQDAVRSSP